MAWSDPRTERNGAFVRVDDFDMYYEVVGEGPPLLLLNGGFGMTATIDIALDAFSRHFRVVAIDARGHGKSGFGKGPVTYAREAADTVGFMDAMGFEAMHVFGHSDGGCAALHLLFDYPHRVLSATLSGTPYSRDSYDAAADAMTKELPRLIAEGKEDPMGLSKTLLGLGMPADKLQRLGAALERAWATTPNISLEMMGAIDRPVLVLEAHRDEYIALERMRDMTRAIPGARAHDLPETTHNFRPQAEEIGRAMAAFVASLGNA